MEVIYDTQNNDVTTPTAILQTSQVSHFEPGFGFPIHNSLATLHRTEDEVELKLDTKLSEGTYTTWWVIFNDPEYCVDGCDAGDFEIPAVNASILWATGEVVGDNGVGSFSAQLLEGELPQGADQLLFGEGLVDSFSAEIHPIVRSHGLVDRELVEEQITTLNGGCPPEGCQDVQFAVFRSVLDPQPSLPQFTVGDFSIGFDATRITDTASGLFVTDTLNSDTILFDLSHPDVLNVKVRKKELTLAKTDLLLSPEFAELLNISDLQGTDVGDARIDAELKAIAPKTFEVESGVTSLFLDLPLLEEIGDFQLAEVDSETQPFSRKFQTGLAISDETDLSFSLADGFVPLDGTIDHEGALIFDVLLPDITVDFEGDDLSAGTIITDQYANIGLTISTSSEFGAMLFDTNNPTGDDFDLAASDLGNVLIVSEDGDTSDPDDNAHGGILTFEWDTLVDITGVGLLDIDEPGSSITFFDQNSQVIETLEIPELENNSFQELGFDVEDVARMDIMLASSGAVTAVDFIPSDAIQTNNGQIVIANRASGNISILDVQTGEELRTVDLPFREGEKPPEPMYVYHLLSTNEIIVDDRANNRVVFFDQTTYEVTRTVETGAGNFHMWVDPQEEQLWVVNDLDVALTVVELETNETTKVQLPEAAIRTNAIPHDVILDPSGLYAYATILREDNPDSDLLVKIDTATFEILDTAEVGKDPHLSLAPESNLLYVPTQNSNRIDVFDRRGTELVKVDSLEQPGVHGIDFSLDGRYLYTTNLPGGGSNGLFAIDTRTNEIVGDLDGVDTPFPTPHNVWLTGDGQRLFLTHSGSQSNQVSFYSLENPTRPVLLDSVNVNGLNPFGLAFAAPMQDDLIVDDNDNNHLRGGNGNDQIFGEDGDDILRGGNGNDKLFGQEGYDSLFGGYDNDVLIAGEDDDLLNGGHGNDVLIGVRVESFTPGKGEFDVFKGSKGSDIFVLGDALEVYYDDGFAQTMGLKDMALIKDFNLDESDVIRLHGSADDYQLKQIEAFRLGTGILYTAEGQAPELVGFVQDVTELDLSSNAFEFAVFD